MSFDYDVMTEEEVQKAREFKLLPAGIYDFAVTEAKFRYSQSGNPMIELKMRVVHDGDEFTVFDYLIGTKGMAWKTKHFCDTTGLQKIYQDKLFNENYCEGRRGTFSLKVLEARPKNDGSGGMYKAKNEVEDYVTDDSMASAAKQNAFSPPETKAAPRQPEVEPFVDSDLPF